jgi:hypothetical protein
VVPDLGRAEPVRRRRQHAHDGSTLTTGAAVNPTSTIGALSQRTGEYIERNFDAVVAQRTTPSNADAPDM